MLALDHDSPTPLVAQIVAGLQQLIESRALKPGARLPSIRQLAQTQGVSVFTVVEAYDRLVALGLVHSKPNAGFFVRPRAAAAEPARADAQLQFDAKWYLRQIFESRALDIKAGCGWLPQDWLFTDGVHRALRQLAQEGSELGGYGSPYGHAGLRGLLVDALAERQIAAGLEHLLLTLGSSQALDLLARHWIRPGDAVLVDAPGYPNIHYILRLMGAVLLPVPRTPEGYDLAALEALLAAHRPKVFFTQPRLHSPSNSTAPLNQLLRILQLAHLHDFAIVENDIYADLDPDFHPSLASLDRLQRVAYLGSFSKTIAPNLRVGYVAAAPQVLEDLATRKMISGLTSSELGERAVFHALTQGRWRKHLGKLRGRLAQAQQDVSQRLLALGFELHTQAPAGMYVWARHPDIPDAAVLSQQAAQQSIMLGPGHLFYPEPRESGWLRFNVAFSADARLWDYIGAQIEETASRAA
ncbi:PLP-dependent aminotransferase family protein [Roseateles saccharophilus]|uniref:GntR family transcriptional regulator n=1 Tax=Roseateles saccharophilus TaxID=304 RepID=A0A4R3VJH7_ROSSA|nr:PLP-dependent aminotransferase family protein [Roseateles saccharophilus]MDG0832899.1 PLP-dependent aminotransferase family protein [Roseateles saccharophilus]TCV04571.1 GntR family transcriptional regulator [Roseateles saccharophilus]